MNEHDTIPHLREIVVFLVAAGILVPALSRLRISPILGYLLVGAIVGPFGLGLLAFYAVMAGLGHSIADLASTGWLVGWPVVLFLIAEPLRNLPGIFLIHEYLHVEDLLSAMLRARVPYAPPEKQPDGPASTRDAQRRDQGQNGDSPDGSLLRQRHSDDDGTQDSDGCEMFHTFRTLG